MWRQRARHAGLGPLMQRPRGREKASRGLVQGPSSEGLPREGPSREVPQAVTKQPENPHFWKLVWVKRPVRHGTSCPLEQGGHDFKHKLSALSSDLSLGANCAPQYSWRAQSCVQPPALEKQAC